MGGVGGVSAVCMGLSSPPSYAPPLAPPPPSTTEPTHVVGGAGWVMAADIRANFAIFQVRCFARFGRSLVVSQVQKLVPKSGIKKEPNALAQQSENLTFFFW